MSSLHSSTDAYQTPTSLSESHQTELRLRQILYPNPSGVLVNSYWTDPKSPGIADS